MLFVLLAMLIISFYGGGFATVPAYLRDLFGTFQVGAIHGRLLTAWSAAGVAGPLIINGFLDAKGTPGKLTVDAYRPALYTMIAILAVGFIANLLIRPVASRFWEPASAEVPDRAGPDREGESLMTMQVRLIFGWALVGIPLLYGLWETIAKAKNLF